MSCIVDSETFKKDRAYAEFHKQDLSAQRAAQALSWWGQVKLCFVPVRVAEVDFGQWPVDDSRRGTPRRLPLYLFTHGDHMSVDYAHGFPGVDERVDCHCGYKHYFITSRSLLVRTFVTLIEGLRSRRRTRAAA